ncbi:MAG: sugar transferase [Caldilineaceae bacterium]
MMGLRFSVIVPVYNGAATIERCLNALAQQRVEHHDFEIIVVDDGSTDSTAAIIHDWMAQHPEFNASLIQQANGGPAAARNTGAKAAQAPLLLFTDADCAPIAEWIEKISAPFADSEVTGVKGSYRTEQRGLTPRFVQAEYEDRYDRMIGQERIDFIDTYSAAYRRDILLENGGFDAALFICEDQEFSFRLAQKGYKLVFAPEAAVTHIHDENLLEYIRRKYSIGYWKALLTRWHPERMVQDSHTPQVLKLQIVLIGALLGMFALALVGLLLPLFNWAWLGVGLLLLTFLMTTLPFANKLARRSPALAIVGVGLLFARALALGSGYVVGTIQFAGTTPGKRQPVIPGWKQFVKRGMDIVGALVGLLISIPLVALAALAIKLDSPGPIFYQQVRIGEHGKPFRILKLRSMVVDAEQQLEKLIDLNQLSEPVYKIKNDPRITRVGKVLRRTSLDEAPQFVNVLLGDMSLVGPRPEEARIVALYQDHHRKRLAVKPGMTGPMQVSGRGNLPLSERLLLEIDYIEHYSLRRDVAILLHTLPAIWHGNGAH